MWKVLRSLVVGTLMMFICQGISSLLGLTKGSVPVGSLIGGLLAGFNYFLAERELWAYVEGIIRESERLTQLSECCDVPAAARILKETAKLREHLSSKFAEPLPDVPVTHDIEWLQAAYRLNEAGMITVKDGKVCPVITEDIHKIAAHARDSVLCFGGRKLGRKQGSSCTGSRMTCDTQVMLADGSSKSVNEVQPSDILKMA